MKILRPKAEEKAVLSILQGSPKVKVELMGALSADHFGYTPTHEAFRVIEKMMVTSSLDLPSMETFLSHPDLDQDTVELLSSPSVSPIRRVDDAKRLVEVLDHYRIVRRFYTFSQDSLARMEEERKADLTALTDDMEECLSDMRSDVGEVPLYHAGRGVKDADADVLMQEVFDNNPVNLIPSSFNNFDSRTGGFGATDLFIPASHKKGGKSIMTLNMAYNMYRSGQSVVYIPLEMNKEETAGRMISMLSGVEHSKIRTKSTTAVEYSKMSKAWKRFKMRGKKNKCRFTVWPVSHTSVGHLRIKLKPFRYNVIVIDYINLLDHPNAAKMQDWQKLNELARELKLMTKDLNALIIAPTQMNEDGSLRYARGLAEHANTVWTWKYGEEEQGTHILTIDQPAVRGWAPFKFYLMEDFSRMKVVDHQGADPENDLGSPVKVKSMKGLK